MQDFETFSTAFNENTDIRGTAYCVVFIRGIDKKFNVTEELLNLLPFDRAGYIE